MSVSFSVSKKTALVVVQLLELRRMTTEVRCVFLVCISEVIVCACVVTCKPCIHSFLSPSTTDLALLKQKKESFTNVIKKLQKSKQQAGIGGAALKKINEQLEGVELELGKLEQEIAVLQISVCSCLCCVPIVYV